MPASVRQNYLDPHDKTHKYCDMLFNLDIVRPDDVDNPNSVIQISVSPSLSNAQKARAINTLNDNKSGFIFEDVFYYPDEVFDILMEARRTWNPLKCKRTRLSKPNDENKLYLENISLLDAHQGDPIIIMSNLLGANKIYSIIDFVGDDFVCLQKDSLKDKVFYKGSIIENLANKWNGECKIIGSKSQLKKPVPPIYKAKLVNNSIDFALAIPINYGTIKYYDIYIRNHPFENIEFHWIPDALDLPQDTIRASVYTFNGGSEAGGGMIKDFIHQQLYCTIISKDKPGFYNVNESICETQIIN